MVASWAEAPQNRDYAVDHWQTTYRLLLNLLGGIFLLKLRGADFIQVPAQEVILV